MIEKNDRKNINISSNIEKADYLINSYRNWKGGIKPINFVPPENFKVFHEIKVDNVPINTIYKKR